MADQIFSDHTPTRTLHVTVGQGTGRGTASDPFHSIQAAVNAATPGTAIIVHAGVYNENVKINHRNGGADDAPVWLVSGDGPQAATIRAVNDDKPVIQALGVDNYVIQGFSLQGGYDGIQFSQSGRDFSNLVENVLIKGNVIKDVEHDGIKVGQADNIQILDNTISDVDDEEGIDFVAVNNALIARNEIYDVGGSSAAIFAKGGSTDVTIAGNYIHDVAGDGVSAGGNTSPGSFRPGTIGPEATNIDVVGNRIEDVGKRPTSVRGAEDVVISDNYLESSGRYGNAVYVTWGSQGTGDEVASSDVLVRDNTVANTKSVLKIDAGNNNNVVQYHNDAGPWSGDAGPDAATLPFWADPAGRSAPAGDSLAAMGMLDQGDPSDLSALGQDMAEGAVLPDELPALDTSFYSPAVPTDLMMAGTSEHIA